MEMKIEQVIVGEERRDIQVKKEPEPVSSTPASGPSKRLQCYECFIIFKEPRTMERHNKKHHPEMYRQQLVQRNTSFTCYMCSQSFQTPDELTQHQLNHRRENKPFRCAACRCNLASFSELSKHRRYECNKRKFMCTICLAMFPRQIQLRRHRLVVHKNEVHQCDKCEAEFDLKVHLMVHKAKFAGDPTCGRMKVPQQKPPVVVEKKIKEEEFDYAVDEWSSSSTSFTSSSTSSSAAAAAGGAAAELQIPCPEDGCELLFSSVAALRAHKKEAHRLSKGKANSTLKSQKDVHTVQVKVEQR